MWLRSVVFVCVLLAAWRGEAAANADVVTRWNAAALDAIRAAATPPPTASRALAILHVAIYDAVNGIVRSHEPYFVRHGAPASASPEAAAAAAGRYTLVALFPASESIFEQIFAETLRSIPDVPQRRRGVDWGELVARQILAWRTGDNSDAIVPVPPAEQPGDWVPTPPAFAPYLLPQWAFVVPFGMPTSSFFRPPGPPSLESPTWAADVNEVEALGAAVGSLRTPEQDLIALFWADGAGTETPPGHWNSIAQQVVADRHATLEDNARLFALLNIALADAAICAWDAKYTYHSWRPITAIRNADTDGNPATVPDSTWNSFIGTPGFPEYVSGHSTFSGAAATVLAAFFGTDRMRFVARSDTEPGEVRHFTSFSAAAREAAMSRLYGGIHFRSANEDGLRAGIEIGAWVVQYRLRPVDHRRGREPAP